MTKQQKGKHRKRLRAWHHGPNQDHIFDRAIRRLDENGCPEMDTATHENKEQETRKGSS
jgi:hypothetical protein